MTMGEGVTLSHSMNVLIVYSVALASVVVAVPIATQTKTGDIALNLKELAKQGKTEEFLKQLEQLAKGLQSCGVKEPYDMKKVYLKNKTVTCNDGSQAGYYLRTSQGSSKWLVFLEGGWYCFDRTSCHGRWLNMPHFMSSQNWPATKKGTGILSWDPEENPFLYNANFVYVPYCSSDSWSGTAKAKGRATQINWSGKLKGEFSFMGSLIVEEVLKDLVPQGLGTAKKLLLAGSSAGAVGVLVNLDRMADMMKKLAPNLDVRGIVDGGWFLDNKQYKPVVCTDAHSCAPTEGIRRGIQLWKGRMPESCIKVYPASEHWRCYFGYRIYPTLKTPVFVVQHLFDEAQITADNVGPPVKKEQWQYIHNMGKDIKRTLMNVSATFAPACLSHILLTRSEWQKVAINDITLPQALKCWESGKNEQNHYSKVKHKKTVLGSSRLITGDGGAVAPVQGDKALGDDPQPVNSKHQRRRHGKRRRRRKRKRGNRRDRDRDRERRRGKRSLLFNIHDIHRMQFHDYDIKCNHHLIDHCAWPQCNFSCPKIRNPFTGEEMDFIDLLMQFGLDLSSIANALGMDLATLQSMDHDVLLRLLTQQN